MEVDVLFVPLALADDPAPADIPVRTERPGCPATAADLPASAYHRPDDPRFTKDDVIVVLKGSRRVGLYDKGVLAVLDDGSPACWAVGLGAGYPSGHKVRLGDMRTPEGWYATSDRPWSVFYGAITVHYPAIADAKRGVRDGLITADQGAAIEQAHARGEIPDMDTTLGGKILLHGGGSSTDWTLGCVALEDDDIDALRARLPKGMRTQVLILP